MFEPHFSITNKLLSGIIEVENNKTVVDLVPVPSEWNVRLKNEALSKKIYSCLRFMGNNLDPLSISKIIAYDPGRDEKAVAVAQNAGVVGKESDIQMVLNWINANRYKDQLVYLGLKFKQTGITEKDLVQINSLLTEKLVPFQKLGAYRLSDLSEKSDIRHEIVPAVEIPYQMEDFYRWYVSFNKEEVHPLIKAGVTFYELVRIWPFDEGNLLTASLFCTLTLDVSGFTFGNLWSYEEALLKNREVLWMYISNIQKNNGDLTEWLEYFVKSLGVSAAELKSKVMMLIGDTPVFRTEVGKVVPLTERQVVIMEDITLRNETTIKEVRSILPSVSDDTILRDLKDLIDKKLIKKKGKTKGATYVLGKVRSFRKVS